jgi:hypothetical protein
MQQSKNNLAILSMLLAVSMAAVIGCQHRPQAEAPASTAASAGQADRFQVGPEQASRNLTVSTGGASSHPLLGERREVICDEGLSPLVKLSG